jgi:hypothetical protein
MEMTCIFLNVSSAKTLIIKTVSLQASLHKPPQHLWERENAKATPTSMRKGELPQHLWDEIMTYYAIYLTDWERRENVKAMTNFALDPLVCEISAFTPSPDSDTKVISQFQIASIQHVARTETLRSVPVYRNPRICICRRRQPIRVEWCPSLHGVESSSEDYSSLVCLWDAPSSAFSRMWSSKIVQPPSRENLVEKRMFDPRYGRGSKGCIQNPKGSSFHTISATDSKAHAFSQTKSYPWRTCWSYRPIISSQHWHHEEAYCRQIANGAPETTYLPVVPGNHVAEGYCQGGQTLSSTLSNNDAATSSHINDCTKCIEVALTSAWLIKNNRKYR